MDATSPAQTQALRRGVLPPLDRVRDDVWALAQPMPGGHLAHSFAYLLKDTDGGVHVIDPGTDSDENWARFVRALTELGTDGPSSVRTIIGTHLHPDHVGMAARLRDASGARLSMHRLERQALARHGVRTADPVADGRRLADWGVPVGRRDELAQYVDRSPEGLGLAVDAELADGEMLRLPGFRLEVMSTPGHTAGHLCLRDDHRNLLYTGDHVLPTVFPGLGLGGPTSSNPLADYLDSVERIRRYPDHEALPGHGYRFTGIADRAKASADHQVTRTREVAAIIAGHPRAELPSIWDIATGLTWTAGWEGLHGFQLLSALTQTAMHLDFVQHHELPAP